jgi:hypothetical protein
MLKDIIYGDKIRNNISGNSLELLDKRDYRTPYDINRPIINLYDELENIYLFLNSFGIYQLTDEGVFTNSFSHAFQIRSSDIKRITLQDTRDSLNIITVNKVYARLAPGIAGVYHNDNRQSSSLIVNKPNIRFFERQVSEILGIFYHSEDEQVKVKYNNEEQAFKAFVRKQLSPTEVPFNFYFGCVDQSSFDNNGVVGISSQELIAQMYNQPDLNDYFVSAIGFNIEQLQLEKLFPITTTGTKYWNVVNGQISLNNSNDGFFLGSFNITNLNPVAITSINNNKIRYGEKVRIDIHGTADDSYQLNSQGGVEFNIAKDFKVRNLQGAELGVDESGNLIADGMEDANINISGSFNVQNVIAQFLIDINGKLTLRISEEDTINTGNKTEVIQGNSITNITGNNNETIQGNETKNIVGDLSLSVNDVNQEITGNNVISIDGSEIKSIDGNLNETILGNEVKNISGNLTETITNDKEVTAKKQTINGIESLSFVSPSIVFNTGENGTISFIGKNQIIEGDTVQLGDNLVELNKNQTGIPSTGLISGFEINRGSLTKAQIIFRESDASWVSGLVGALKAIANREDDSVIVNTGIPSWDNTDKIFKTDSKFLHNRTTGTATINTNNATTTPPIATNSSAKINNMNVDKVDGVDINSTGAANGEIAMWTGENIIGTSDKVFSTNTGLSSNSDNNIPTEKAVKSYVDSIANTLNSAIALKSNIASPTFTGIVTAPNLILTGNGDGTDTDNVFIKDSLNKLKTRAIHSAVWSADNAAFRTAIGAGTSSLTLGSTSSTAYRGDHGLAAYNHITSDGSSHGFINQDVKSTASPTFNNLNLTGHLTSLVLKSHATANTNGTFYSGTTAPSGDARLNYSGNFHATKLLGSVYNDIADFVIVPENFEIEYGRVYFRDENYEIVKTNKKGQCTSLGIASDTFGFGIGSQDEKIKTMPIAIGGWVLAYVDKEYPSGTKLVASKNGSLTKASFFSSYIVAIYDRPEKKEKWNDIVVNNRHWVKVV